MVTASPASADARSGVCGKESKLANYTFTQPAYDSAGEKMFSITWSKRWCYSVSAKRVQSAYSPSPAVKIYNYFDVTWKNGGILSQDAYYTNVDAKGKKHPKYSHWGHAQWWLINMKHCAVKWAVCTNNYYKVGTIGYWDGSKKLIYSES